MGLDTSHNCWHGPYSSFTRWRHKLAEVAGYSIVKVEGDHIPQVMIDWGHITDANLHGQWEKTPEDPLIVLIAHHDHDGEIHPAQAIPLADRLEALLPLLSDEGFDDHARKTRQFIDGLRDAAAEGEAVDFH